jgi:alkylhydroperoxidase family enzyme
LKARYGDRVEFLGVYVREAHPTDGWRMKSNDKAGITIAQPITKLGREAIAGECCSALKMTIPLVVDDIDDRVGHLYSGMPDRLYLIDKNGRIAYKGGRGPFGFTPGELEQAIIMNQLEEIAPAPKKEVGRVPVLSNAEAWAKLPQAKAYADAPSPKASLPVWARALAGVMPHTTAAMLELDYLQRAKSPLDPKLRAKMRWVAANANRSPNGEAYALADFRRAGGADAEIAVLKGDPKQWPAKEKEALTFARKLTKEAYKILDDEVARLRATYGDAQVVAMVQLLAYANFQDRLLLTLRLNAEEGGPLPPLAVEFQRPWSGGAEAPKRVTPKPANGSTQAPASDSEWSKVDYSSLQKLLADQRTRQPRIPVPTFDSVRKYLPATYPKSHELRIRWSLVCLGYQPELASAWSLCTRSFAEESQQDRVFEESLFWVVTRSLQCFY